MTDDAYAELVTNTLSNPQAAIFLMALDRLREIYPENLDSYVDALLLIMQAIGAVLKEDNDD